MKTVFGDLDEGKHPRLSGGDVAYGNYNPGNDKVKFNYNDSSYEDDDFGFREEIFRNKGASRSFLRCFLCQKIYPITNFFTYSHKKF